MKKLFFAVMGLLLCCGGYAQEKAVNKNGFTINGTVKDYNGKVYLTDEVKGQYVRVDSTEAVNGVYSFSGGNVDWPRMMHIELEGVSGMGSFILENGEINIRSNDTEFFYHSTRAHNTLNNEVFNKYRIDEEYYTVTTHRAEVMIEMLRYPEKMEDAEYQNQQFQRRSREGTQISRQLRMTIVETYPDEVISLIMLRTLAPKLSADSLEMYLGTIDDKFDEHPYTKELQTVLNAKYADIVGATAPNFTATDSKGKTVELKELRGDYVLLDFWATWCAPCRREIPILKQLNSTYGKKGLKIVGISLDEDEAKWRSTIEAQKMNWIHICDSFAWNGEIAVNYNVQAVPKTVLVDPEGKIVAIDVRGEKLVELIKSLLD